MRIRGSKKFSDISLIVRIMTKRHYQTMNIVWKIKSRNKVQMRLKEINTKNSPAIRSIS